MTHAVFYLHRCVPLNYQHCPRGCSTPFSNLPVCGCPGGWAAQFGCELTDRYAGTLFRFPLRTEGTAALSEIKKEAYTEADVLSLLGA